MKALISGGAGFIGSNIASLLVQEGFKVRVLDNLSTGSLENIDSLAVEFIQGDIRDPLKAEQACQDVDVIFHLAAHIGNVRSLEFPIEDSSTNVLGTLTLLEAARKAGVPRFIHTSSAAIFGELITMPIAEDHPLNPDSPYGVSKLSAEKHALCYAKQYGMCVICLRYFNVYGIHQRYDAYGNVIPIFAERLYGRQPLTIYGDGQQTRDFINVTDVARANLLAATRAMETAVYNVGSGESITIQQLADWLIEISEAQETKITYAPPRAGEVRHCRADIQKIQRALDFSPQEDLKTGLKEYYAWFKEAKKIGLEAFPKEALAH